MYPPLSLRLVFDATAASLLLIGLAYWWLGNAVHEVAGTAMFLLVILHNFFNRRWYGSIGRTSRDARGALNASVTLLLLIAMLTLLLTSALISHALPRALTSGGEAFARRIHSFAAYWALIILAIHLGLRWPVIMSAARGLFGISEPSAARAFALRLIAGAIAIHGVWSSFELGVGARLAMEATPDWWDFEAAAAGFFRHCVAIVGLYAALTHYAVRWIQRRKRGSASGTAVA